MSEPLEESQESSRARIPLFLALTLILSWPLWFVSGILERRGAGIYDHTWLLAQVGVMAPSLAAILVSFKAGPRLRRNALRILGIQLLPLAVPGLLIAAQAPERNTELGVLTGSLVVAVALLAIGFFSPLHRGLLLPGTGRPAGRPGQGSLVLALLLFPALFLVAWGLTTMTGGRGADAGGTTARAIAIAFSFNLILGGALGEEVGWRGFLLPQLLKRSSPLAASLLLGLVWALWHLPIDLASGFAVQGPLAIFARIFWTLPVSVIFTWLYLRSRGSLLVALFLHTSLNVLPDLGLPSFERAVVAMSFVNLAVAIGIVALAPSFRRATSDPA